MFPEVVEHWRSLGNWTQQWTTLRNVIDLFVRLGVDAPAAVLLGAVRAADTAAPAFGPDAESLAAARGLLLSRLGPARFTSEAALGESMSADDVVAFACAELRRAGAALVS
jgi:hypothetical protein